MPSHPTRIPVPLQQLSRKAPSLKLERLDRSLLSTSGLTRQILVEVRDLLIEDEPIEEIVMRIHAGQALGAIGPQ